MCIYFFCCAFTATAQQMVPWYINAKCRVDFNKNTKPQIVLLNSRLPLFFNPSTYIENIQYDYMGKFIIYNTYPMLFYNEKMDSISVYQLFPDSLYMGTNDHKTRLFQNLAWDQKDLILPEKDNRYYKFTVNHYTSRIQGDSIFNAETKKFDDSNGGIYYSRFVSDGKETLTAGLDSAFGTKRLNNKNVFGLVGAKKKNGGHWIITKTLDGNFFSYPIDSGVIGKPIVSSIVPIDTFFGKGVYYEKIDYSEKLHTLVCIRNYTNDSFIAVNKYIRQFIKYNFDNKTGLFSLNKYWMDSLSYSAKWKIWPEAKHGCFTPDDSFYITANVSSKSIPFVAFNMHDSVLKPIAIKTCDKKYINSSPDEVSNVAVASDGSIYFYTMYSDYLYINKVTYPFDTCPVIPYYSSYPFTFISFDSWIRPSPPDVFYDPHPINFYVKLDTCTKPLKALFINKSDTIYKQFTLYFGDGDSVIMLNKYGDTITHYYNIAGKLNYTVKGIDALRFSAWLSDSIWVTSAPVKAQYGSFASLTCQKADISFTDLSKTDTFTQAGSYWHWDFGDNTDTSFSLNGLPNGRGTVSHRYDTSGYYKVKLVYNNGFCSDTFIGSQQIYIAPTPRSGFQVDPKMGCVPQLFTVTPNYKDSIFSEKYYIYNNSGLLKDSFVSNSTKPTFPLGFSFTQKDSGSFIILKQKLNGTSGCISYYQDSVKIYSPPHLKLMNDTFICKDEILQISAIAGYKYIWNTGDTAQSIIVNSGGAYSVKVINGACTVSDSVKVIQDLNESCKFRLVLFPNPCNSQFTISLYTRNKQNINIQLYDMAGRQVASYDNVQVDQFENLVFDVNNLASAMYIMRLNTTDKKYILKFVKLLE